MTDQIRPIGPEASRALAGAPQVDVNTGGGPNALIRIRIKSVFDRLAQSQKPIAMVAIHLRAAARGVYKNFGLYVTDICLVGLSLVLATIFRFGLDAPFSPHGEYWGLLLSVPLCMITSLIVFPLTGLYQRNWRYVSINDLLAIVKSVVLSLLIFVAVLFAVTRLELTPRSVFVIDFLIIVPLLTVVRLRSRLHELKLHSLVRSATMKRDLLPILLVGAGDEADTYLRALQNDRNSQYFPVGLLDDEADQLGMKIRGVSVLGTLADFGKVLRFLEERNCRPRHVVFAKSPSKFASQSVELLTIHAETLGIAVSRLTSPTELRKTHKLTEFEVRPIELTDLLERAQTALDRGAISRLIQNRKVLVTGAGGSIGSELTLQVAALNPSELILVDNTELNLYNIDMALSEKFPSVFRLTYLCNIREQGRVNEIFERHRPDLVFHTAALKHVPMVELNPSEGVLTNVIGTMNIAEASRRINAMAMVQVSTDKVVNPTSVMGLTKRFAELYCQALDLDGKDNPQNSRFMTVRFGNVLGSSGSLIPLFQRQIASGGPLTVTHPEMTRFFMTIREAVELTLRASAHGLEQRLQHGEIFVLDMGEPVKIIDVARRMIRLAGYTPDEDIKIKIIGCRPGEKLHEELFDSSERRVDSSIAGAFGAASVPIDLGVLKAALAELKHAAETGDIHRIFGIAAELLPNYRKLGSGAEPLGVDTTAVVQMQLPVEGRHQLQC
jgi:FlaA1/EpsC-like NDP-sugar epimerase